MMFLRFDSPVVSIHLHLVHLLTYSLPSVLRDVVEPHLGQMGKMLNELAYAAPARINRTPNAIFYCDD